jgi:hypothetical protein
MALFGTLFGKINDLEKADYGSIWEDTLKDLLSHHSIAKHSVSALSTS